jgi:hypothetical protein
MTNDTMPEKIWAYKYRLYNGLLNYEWFDCYQHDEAIPYIRADLVPPVTDDSKREALHVSELPEDVLQRIITSKVAKENDPEYQAIVKQRDELLKRLKRAMEIIQGEYPENQWDYYEVSETMQAIANAESGK